ncbi:hypothetical protein NPIL_20471 [Nephila pilipes]|uniref:Uncharacterized protein n=1 Tax=Nephila pilipes TaxID=299642 RepID=A0A8X6P0D5_NEPPI|nr:hypothetical protein NPIL_20471 [Nephila pilipes]
MLPLWPFVVKLSFNAQQRDSSTRRHCSDYRRYRHAENGDAHQRSAGCGSKLSSRAKEMKMLLRHFVQRLFFDQIRTLYFQPIFMTSGQCLRTIEICTFDSAKECY